MKKPAKIKKTHAAIPASGKKGAPDMKMGKKPLKPS